MHLFHLALLLLVAAPAWSAPTYTISNLGGFGGNRNSAFAINQAGVAAGVSSTTGAYTDLPVWHDGVQLRALSQSSGQANSINSSGMIAGTTYTGSHRRATVWSDGVAHELPTLGGTDSDATEINERGHVVGSATTASGIAHAFLQTAEGMTDLGTLGGSWSSAYGVNNSDEVVGYSMTSAGYMRAFLWQPGRGMQAVPGLGGRNSYAFDISESGSVVGAANTRSGYSQAFLHRAGSTAGLGTLGGTESFAYGINNADHVVGYSYDSRGRSRAFLWIDGTLFDLNALAGNPDGWTLDAAFDINDAGQIVGAGTFNGVAASFRLDPVFELEDRASDFHQSAVPEPSTGILLVIGAVALGVRLKWGRR